MTPVSVAVSADADAEDLAYPLAFSGWEPDAVVRWVRSIRAVTGRDPHCRVVGREPVTSTALFIEGFVTEERHDKYDRGLTVTTADGSNYKVGGTNTTSSIAAFLTLLDVPASMLPEAISDWGVIHEVVQRLAAPGADAAPLDALEYWARADQLAQTLRDPLASLLPSGRAVLEELLLQRPLIPGGPAPDGLWDQLTAELCQRGRLNPTLQARICSVLTVLPSQKTLEFLVDSLESTAVAVTRAAAMGLRDMEYVAQRLTSESPYTMSLLLGRLLGHLHDLPDAETRVYLAEALGYLGVDDEDVLETLTAALSDDDEPHVRWAAAVAIGRRTRAVEALDVLLQAVRREDDGRARRASLLSLGRLLKRSESLLAVQTPTADIEELLLELLDDSDDGIATYAAYALGELPAVSSRAVDVLLQNLDGSRSYPTLAHVVLALSKVQARQRMSVEQQRQLGAHMAEPFLRRDEREHPASSYHEWLTLTGWRVLARLEVSDQAAQFAMRASHLFRRFPARSHYFSGLAYHQLAEHALEAGDATLAVANLDAAIEAFNAAARAQRVAGDLGDAALGAAVTRARLASARRSILLAISGIEGLSFRTRGEQSPIPDLLRAARDSIENVLKSRPTIRTGVPTHDDSHSGSPADSAVKILEWMRDATYLLEEVEDLRQALAIGAVETELRRRTGILRAVVARMGGLSRMSASRQIEETQDLLVNDIESSGRADEASPGVAQEESARLVSYLLRTLRCPIAIPEIDHRLLGAGRARCTVLAQESVAGEGVADDPWIFSYAGRVALRAVVQVELRSEEELLLLRCEDQSGVLSETLVQVHEGSEAIEIELSDQGSEHTTVACTLTFVSSGGTEEIFAETYHLGRMDPPVRSETTSELLDDITSLRSKETRLKEDVTALQRAADPTHVALLASRKAELAATAGEVQERLRHLALLNGPTGTRETPNAI